MRIGEDSRISAADLILSSKNNILLIYLFGMPQMFALLRAAPR